MYEKSGEVIAKTLGELKGAVMKVGQMASVAADMLPKEVNRISNNYNHRFEAPTLFYAIAISLAVAGLVDPLHVGCAWAFTLLRIAHSGVQATIDVVMVRFGLFLLSWVALGVMIVRGALAVF